MMVQKKRVGNKKMPWLVLKKWLSYKSIHLYNSNLRYSELIKSGYGRRSEKFLTAILLFTHPRLTGYQYMVY